MRRNPVEKLSLKQSSGRSTGWLLAGALCSSILLASCGKAADVAVTVAAPAVRTLLKTDLLRFTVNALVGNVFNKTVFEPLWGLIAPDATAEQLTRIQAMLAEQGAQKLVSSLVTSPSAAMESTFECNSGESDADCEARVKTVLAGKAEEYATGLREAFLSCRDEAALSPAHAGKEHHQLVEVIEQCVTTAGYGQEVAALAGQPSNVAAN